MSKNNDKNNKKTLKFLILQVILFLLLIFIIVSVSLNAKFIIELDNFVFNITDFIRIDFINNFLLIITTFGESFVFVILVIFFLIYNFKKIGFPPGFLTMLSAIINFCLKNLVQRTRPVGQFVNNLIFNYQFPASFSFPSGHSQTSLVFYFMLSYFLLQNYKGKHKKLFLTLTCIFVSLIALSRIVLGVHYFSDVVAGILIGLIIISNYIFFCSNKK